MKLTRIVVCIVAIALAASACSSGGDVVSGLAQEGNPSTPVAEEVAPETTTTVPLLSLADTPLDQIDQAELMWSQLGVTAYTYTLVDLCIDCRQRSVRVTVIDDEVEVTRRGNPTDAEGFTAEQLFDRAREVAAWGADVGEASEGLLFLDYDPTGFVSTADVRGGGIVDLGLGFAVNSVVVLETADTRWEGANCAPVSLANYHLGFLDEAEARWEASGITSYTYTFRQWCQCDEEFLGEHVVVVVDGAVTEVTKDGNPSAITGRTAEDFFALARDVLNDGQEVRIDYNPETGFMDIGALDLHSIESDGGFDYETSNFTVTATSAS